MERNQKYGKLKIFFGYSECCDNDNAMFSAALKLKRNGIDVVVGQMPHAGNGASIAKRFEMSEAAENGEFDVSVVLQRKPQLVLLSNLAHLNAPNSRHTMRRQDVEELLKAGIDVFTTLNVQNIESLNDAVLSITGFNVEERVPDALFDSSEAVEYIDVEPEALLRRNENKLSLDQLNALRELAMRRCAERISRMANVQNQNTYRFANEHVLVCLSSSPSNEKIIRTAARMANAFRSRFTALYVETPSDAYMGEENRERLSRNIYLARSLGAQIETVHGDDVPFQIAEFARLSGATRIVVGRSAAVLKWGLRRPTLTDRLIASAPDIDIHVIPDRDTVKPYHSRIADKRYSLKDTFCSMAILAAACFVNMVFYNLGFSDASIILVFILGVLLTAVATTRQIYSIVSAALSVILFNFIFIEPRFTLRAFDPGYPITFAVMFLAAYIAGSLTIRLKDNARQSAQAAYRTQILLDTDQLLNRAESREDIVRILAEQLTKLLNRDIVVYQREKDDLETPQVFSIGDAANHEVLTSKEERAVAEWVFRNNKHAGATTNTFSEAHGLYLAIRTGNYIYGVLGVALGKSMLDSFESSILQSMLGEGALALENEKNLREKEEVAVLAKNEAMRANLLRMISHDLRTPLTSISGNASNLLSDSLLLDEETRRQIYNDIHTDSMWLINLVENLLSITRIEDGHMQLHPSAELMEEIVDEAVKHVNRRNTKQKFSVEYSDDYLLVHADAKLIVQVMINLLDNAVKHTPAESEIHIHCFRQDDMVYVRVMDEGEGIPNGIKEKIFDMFYTGSSEVADSRRSMGLGLYLCKSVINAHGGLITVRDNVPCGSIFEFSLPVEEVHLFE